MSSIAGSLSFTAGIEILTMLVVDEPKAEAAEIEGITVERE